MRTTSSPRPPLSTLGVATLVALVGAPLLAHADPLDPWKSAPIRDATGSDLAKSMRPDWGRVMRAAPSSAAHLAGARTIEVRRNYLYLQDTDGTLTIPPRSNQHLNEWLEFVFQGVYDTFPDEFVFIYTFTSFETNIGAFFYAPLVNTDVGIGQQRFNQGIGSRFLEGYVFMNDWQSFNSQFRGFPNDVIQGFARGVFNQEAGHRWGVQFDAGPGVRDGYLTPLLGRDEAHWSYFASTGGSPMEGNDWRDNGNGTFTTQTDPRAYDYSDVDLYLMGLIPPAEVQPWFLISNPVVTGLTDIYGQPLAADSPPQIFDPQTVRGTRQDFTIQDLVTRLGTRSPAAGRAPTRWRVVFVMLASQDDPLSAAQKTQFETMVDMYAEGFRTGTRGLGSLDYELVPSVPLLPIGELCEMATQCAAEAPICTRPALGNDNVCTRACANASGCPSGYCCAEGPAVGSNVCMPAASCPLVVPDAGVSNPDAGSTTTDPDGGAGPGPGGEDGGTGTPAVCACDTTTACDQGCESCDPECRAPTLPEEPSSCASTGPSSLAALAWLGLAVLVLRRRRAA